MRNAAWLSSISLEGVRTNLTFGLSFSRRAMTSFVDAEPSVMIRVLVSVLLTLNNAADSGASMRTKFQLGEALAPIVSRNETLCANILIGLSLPFPNSRSSSSLQLDSPEAPSPMPTSAPERPVPAEPTKAHCLNGSNTSSSQSRNFKSPTM